MSHAPAFITAACPEVPSLVEEPPDDGPAEHRRYAAVLRWHVNRFIHDMTSASREVVEAAASLCQMADLRACLAYRRTCPPPLPCIDESAESTAWDHLKHDIHAKEVAYVMRLRSQDQATA